MNNELYIEKEEERIYKEELDSLRASAGDFRLFFQEASHCKTTPLKSLHVAYMRACKTGTAVDYAELGQVFAGLINLELEKEAKNMTEYRMENIKYEAEQRMDHLCGE